VLATAAWRRRGEAAVLVLVLIMRGRVGENAVADRRRQALDVRPPVGGRAADERDGTLLRDAPGQRADAYERRIDDWRRRLEAAGARVATVDEAGLATLAIAPGTVLVAPSAAALDRTVTRILDGRARNGVVATWAFALYDGEASGAATVARTARKLRPSRPETVAAPRFVALHGQTSLTVACGRCLDSTLRSSLPLTTDAVADYVDWAMSRARRSPRYQTAVARHAAPVEWCG
jgi:hypothetical protein